MTISLDTALARRVALVSLALFAAVLAAEHLLAPELEPDDHRVSEFVNADAGWLMTVGFAAWAISLVLTAGVVRRRAVLAGSLALAGMGMVVTAAFATETVAGEVPAGGERTVAGELHDAGSATVLIGFVVAAAADVRARGNARLRGVRSAIFATALVAAGALVVLGDPVPGIRQRVLIAGAVGWQALLLVSRPGGASAPPRAASSAAPRSGRSAARGRRRSA